MNVSDIRPKNFEEFIGKNEIKDSLKIYIDSAKKENRILDHLLFYGYAGNGKTSLANIVANELNQKIHFVQGPSIQTTSDVLDLISMIDEGDVIFIDEVHNVETKCFELFYSVLEDFVIDIKIGKELNASYSRLKVPKFTLIASTTNLGKLPEPFIDRFSIKYFFDYYSIEEIFHILEKINNNYEALITVNELKIIASVSKGNPRIAINILKRFRDYRLLNLDLSVEEILNKIGIYKNGLEQIDFNYLKAIYNNFGKPIGIKTISQALSIDIKTIELKIEPFLLKQGYIIKKTNGRSLTDKGIAILSPLFHDH